MRFPEHLRPAAVQLSIRWVLVIIPTAVIGYLTLRHLNFSYTAFNSSIQNQAVYFGTGLLIAYSLYFFRARWVVTFLLLWLVYWVIGRIIVKLPGEFDVFYATAMFQLYATLFLFGWGFGFLLMRVRLAYIVLVAILALANLVTISNTIDVSLTYILLHLTPVFLYGLYMLFLSPLVAEGVEIDVEKSWSHILRLSLFLLLVLAAFILAERLLRPDLKAVEKELAARGAKSEGKGDGKDGYDERHGLMERGKDDGLKLKDTMKIDSKMSSSDRLMFASKLDNYFPDGSPQPLYFVYHYLTRYDPVKESFIRDLNVPSFDEFDVDPAELLMYQTKEDSGVIRNAKGKKKRKVVKAEVYISSNTWKHALLAPASPFFCQTIPVEKDFQKTFQSAYKVKSYSSELNNAYFVYNPSANPQLAPYQEERHEELRSVSDYHLVDTAFYNYYTQMPTGRLYDSIADLAKKSALDASTPVDKVIAVRDFFLQRDEYGKLVFKYTLKPGAAGDPNIPNASMLGNFLFKTHAGYCTYYAGASLFMLRSLGIPARFTTGFATINRGDKNKGWYWFYASQAHAWTQVYFPGYGWLDFDMTIGNEDQQGAPRPDGTPPLPPPEPWLVINGIAPSAPDSASRQLDITFKRIMFYDENYDLNKTFTRRVDASVCRVLYDKKDTLLSVIQPGDSIIVVSYNDAAKVVPQPREGIAIETQVAQFPSPIIADEIHIKVRASDAAGKDEKEKTRPKPEEKRVDWRQVGTVAAEIMVGLLLLIILLPLLVAIYLLLRAKLADRPQIRADRVYKLALYQFHMAGLERERATPLNYAIEKVDPSLQAGFAAFMQVYLRLKYGKGALLEGDKEIIEQFASRLGSSIRAKHGLLSATARYFNLLLASRYFMRSDNYESDNQTTPS